MEGGCADTGTAIDQSLDVVGERAGRNVAAFGFGVDCLEHDIVQIAAQRTARDLRRCRQDAGITVLADLGRRRLSAVIGRALSADQFTEQNSERVDIRGRRDLSAAALFGCCVSGCIRMQLRLQFLVVVEEFGNAKIQQLDLTVVCDQHVGRFEVAMHDQGTMRSLDGAARLLEQAQPPAQIESMLARIFGQRFAVDEFQRDIGKAVVGNSTFDETGDTWVAQLSQCLALATELLLRVRRIQTATQYLERDVLTHAFDLANGVKHRRGASFAENRQQFERSDVASGRQCLRDIRITDHVRCRFCSAEEDRVISRIGHE